MSDKELLKKIEAELARLVKEGEDEAKCSDADWEAGRVAGELQDFIAEARKR